MMEARNCQELGINLQKIISRLLTNDELVNLLYYTDMDPLAGAPLSMAQKQTDVYEKLIRVVPKIGTKNNAQSLIVVYISGANGLSDNNEFKQVRISIDIYTPLTQWIIKDSNLRPFAIIGQIQKSLNGKTVNGLGKLKCGDFGLTLITEDVSCYQLNISVTEYD